MRARRPLRTRKRINPENKERKATLREKQFGDDHFITWLHRLQCSVPGCDARDVEQAHAKSRAAGGDWTDSLPLCREHHREQHDIGLLTFEAKYGIDLRDLAAMVQWKWSESNG